MFADNLKVFRMEKSVSQQEIADYLQITRQAYNYYENGKREPDYKTLLKLSEYFNITVDDLLNENMSQRDKNLAILNRNARKLSKEDRKKLLDMAKLIFKEEFNDWPSQLYISI